MITYRKRRMHELSKDERTKLFRLTLRGGSHMNYRLHGRLGNRKKTFCVIANDTEAKKFIGWAFAEKKGSHASSIGVFVATPYRRKGIGRKLVQRVLEYAGTNRGHCMMHDWRSSCFYENLKAEELYGWGKYGEDSVIILGEF